LSLIERFVSYPEILLMLTVPVINKVTHHNNIPLT